MPSLQQCYPLPEHIPTLTNDELRRIDPRWVGKCPTCRDTGFFLWDHDEEDNVVDTPIKWECSCLDQIILSYYLLRCGLNRNLYWRALEELPEFEKGADPLVEYVSSADKYVNSGLGLKLTGDPYCGKSTWATYLMKVLIAHQCDVQSMSLDTLADTYSATWNGKNKDASLQQVNMEHFTQRVMQVPVLLIDNIGLNNKRSDASTVEQAFIRVTSERAEKGKVTLFTYCRDENDPLVKTDHIDDLTIHVRLRGPNLQQISREQKRADMHAGIQRPVRLL